MRIILCSLNIVQIANFDCIFFHVLEKSVFEIWTLAEGRRILTQKFDIPHFVSRKIFQGDTGNDIYHCWRHLPAMVLFIIIVVIVVIVVAFVTVVMVVIVVIIIIIVIIAIIKCRLLTEDWPS